jgi:hypothetical protein
MPLLPPSPPLAHVRVYLSLLLFDDDDDDDDDDDEDLKSSIAIPSRSSIPK